MPGGAPRKVPVIEVGDVAVFDSTRILKFLDEAYPDTPRFDPKDDAERAQSDTIEDWVDEEFIRALVAKGKEVNPAMMDRYENLLNQMTPALSGGVGQRIPQVAKC